MLTRYYLSITLVPGTFRGCAQSQKVSAYLLDILHRGRLDLGVECKKLISERLKSSTEQCRIANGVVNAPCDNPDLWCRQMNTLHGGQLDLGSQCDSALGRTRDPAKKERTPIPRRQDFIR